MTVQLEQNQQAIKLNTPDNSDNAFAGAAGGDKHTLTIILKSEKKDDFIMTVPEIAKLVYSQLLAPPKSLISFDNSAYGKLTVVLYGCVDLDKLNLTTGFQIRDGLWTKPFKETKKKINIYWAPASLSNQSIKEKLEKFGKVHDVKNKIYKTNNDDDPITAMMDGVILPERESYMTVLLPIPRHILVDGLRVKIVYEGQIYFCENCLGSWEKCPGDSAECRVQSAEYVKIALEALKAIQLQWSQNA